MGINERNDRSISNKIYIFGLIHGDKVTSAVCINVSLDILYVFYWGEEDSYERLSPMAFLSEKLVNLLKKIITRY